MSVFGFAFRRAIGALGTVVAALTFTACSGSGSTSTTPIAWNQQAATSLMHRAQGSPAFVYVSNQSGGSPAVGSVLYYPVGSNGDVAPSGAISGSNTHLAGANGIVVDSGGEIYVANSDTNTIVGFAPGSNGNITPNVLISGSNTGLATPIGLALDSDGNLYVSNCGQCHSPSAPDSVEEFTAGSNGNATPIRTIVGQQTQLNQVNQLAVDGRGYIYVANATVQKVTVFGPRSNGNVAPMRVLSGQHSRVNEPDGIAVDGRNLYVTSAYRGYIGRFDSTARGNVPPRSVLHVGWSNGGQQVLGGIITAPDETLYVTGFSVPLIAQYAPRAHGTPVPLTQIEGPSTQLVLPTFVFVK
jgi:sugar lactone lactonase YvrE